VQISPAVITFWMNELLLFQSTRSLYIFSVWNMTIIFNEMCHLRFRHSYIFELTFFSFIPGRAWAFLPLCIAMMWSFTLNSDKSQICIFCQNWKSILHANWNYLLSSAVRVYMIIEAPVCLLVAGTCSILTVIC